MKRIRSKGTGLERKMKNILMEMGLRCNEQPPLYGNPDFRIRGTNVLVFCDSEFWHGRAIREKKKLPRFHYNKKLWTEKLLTNIKRDRKVNQRLRKAGWKVLRFWDKDILKCEGKIQRRIRKAL